MPGINQTAVLDEALAAINEFALTQQDAVTAAGVLIADCVAAGGVLHAFGTGHSQAVAMEIAGRAGGLIPTNRVSLHDIYWYGKEEPVNNRLAERDPEVARKIFDLAPVHPGDTFVIASNSGINGAVVELARMVTAAGHRLIALTSLAHSSAVASRHSSGKKLADLADVVIDNGAPIGDAVLDLPDGGKVCAVSSITSTLAAQMIVAEAVRELIARGLSTPVYLSANVPDGDKHNGELERRYEGRIRRGGA